MQENNFVEAFKNIKPTKEEKENILNNIFNHSSKRKSHSLAILKTCGVGVFTFCMFFLYNISIQEVPNNRTRIMPVSLSYNEFSYDGKCYKETSIIEKEIGVYLGMMKMEGKSCLLYAHRKDDNIVFLFSEGNYIPYEEIECK